MSRSQTEDHAAQLGTSNNCHVSVFSIRGRLVSLARMLLGSLSHIVDLDKRRTPSRFATKGAFATLFSQGFQLPCPPWARKQAKTGWGKLG